MAHILSKFLSLNSSKRFVLIEAILFIYSVKAILLVLPIKKVMNISLTKKETKECNDPEILLELKWALQNANDLSLWKNRCLINSIAGRWLLQRRGITSLIFFGLKHDHHKNQLIAHAWLMVGGFYMVDSGLDWHEISRY